MFGHPRLRLPLTSNRPIAYVSAKITDVFPDGASSLVVRGMTNIAHRGRTPSSPTPASRSSSTWSSRRRRGRSRPAIGSGLDLAGADWPNAWPPPCAATLYDRSRIARCSSCRCSRGRAGRRDPPPFRVVTGQQHGPESNEEGWWRWEVDEPADGMHVARTGYGGTSTNGARRAAIRDRYEGMVGVSTSRSRVAFADGEGEFEIGFPEATVRTQSRVRVDSTAEAYPSRSSSPPTRTGSDTAVSKRWHRTIRRATDGPEDRQSGRVPVGEQPPERPRSRRAGSGRSRTATPGAT